MWYTGAEPFTKKPVTTARSLRDRKPRRALVQSFEPENDFLVRGTLTPAGPTGSAGATG